MYSHAKKHYKVSRSMHPQTEQSLKDFQSRQFMHFFSTWLYQVNLYFKCPLNNWTTGDCGEPWCVCKGKLQMEWVLECNEKPVALEKRFCAYSMKYSKTSALILVALGEGVWLFIPFHVPLFILNQSRSSSHDTSNPSYSQFKSDFGAGWYSTVYLIPSFLLHLFSK